MSADFGIAIVIICLCGLFVMGLAAIAEAGQK